MASSLHRTSGFRWVVMASAFFSMLFNTSINYNAGVINEAVIDHFQADPVDVSWLLSFYCSLFALAAPLASIIILLTDCRTCVILAGLFGLAGFASSALVESMPMLYLTFFFAGVAQSLSQSGSVLVLSYYFPNNLHIVHGVCLSGTGLGSFFHPVLSQAFVDNFGFSGAMLLLAGISFHSTICGLLFRPTSLELKSKEISTKCGQSKWKVVCSKIIPPADIFKIPAFAALIPAVFLFSFSVQSMVVLLPSYIKTYVGLSIQDGSIAAMVFGGGSVISRLFSGIAASDEKIGDSLLFVGMSGLLSVLCFCGSLIIAQHHGVFIYSFFFGFYSGGIFSLCNTILMDIVGIDRAAHAYGFIMLVYGLGGITGPPIIAWLLELQGANMLFVVCGVISSLCTVFGLLTFYLRKFIITDNRMDISIKDMSIYVDGGGIDAKDVLLMEDKNADGEVIIATKRGLSFVVEKGIDAGLRDNGSSCVHSNANSKVRERLLSVET